MHHFTKNGRLLAKTVQFPTFRWARWLVANGAPGTCNGTSITETKCLGFFWGKRLESKKNLCLWGSCWKAWCFGLCNPEPWIGGWYFGTNPPGAPGCNRNIARIGKNPNLNHRLLCHDCLASLRSNLYLHSHDSHDFDTSLQDQINCRWSLRQSPALNSLLCRPGGKS